MEVKKRQSWEIEETKYFLNLIRKRQIMKCLDNRKFRADEVFKYLEKSMHEKGYKKDWKQMQTRFKTLRQQYNGIKRKMGKSGWEMSDPYATEMSDLLDSRPIAIEEGIDSSCMSEDSSNTESGYVSRNAISISLNEKNDSNDFIYEDAPDPTDGAVPGCSKDTDDESITITQCSQSNKLNTTQIDCSTDSSSSNKTYVQRQKLKGKGRSYESIVMKYADKMKQTFEKNQENLMVQTKEYVSKLIDSEKEMIDKVMDNHRSILQETTNQLLHGLQNIFGTTTTRIVNTSHMIPSIVPSLNEAVFISKWQVTTFPVSCSKNCT